LSGGIDSSVCLALSVKAFGTERVVGIAMPEADSNPESAVLARQLARQFGVRFIVEDMTAAQIGFGTYQRRDEAIRRVFPEYDPTYKAKIVLPNALDEKFKTQVYQLAEYLNIPEEIRKRPPTTDTYSAECTQEEFFFRVPFEIGDLVWLGMERGVPTAEIAQAAGLTESQVENIMRDIRQKIRATEYLRMEPFHLDTKEEVVL